MYPRPVIVIYYYCPRLQRSDTKEIKSLKINTQKYKCHVQYQRGYSTYIELYFQAGSDT